MSTVTETSDSSLLELLRLRGPLGIQDLADETGVTQTAVRQRLNRLMGQGLVGRETVRAQRGRPSHRYLLTEKARRRQGTNFADLAQVMWQELLAIEDQQLREQLVLRIARGLAQRYAAQVGGETSQQRMIALRELFHQRGVPFTVESADGLPVLQAHDCPYPKLAEQDRRICDMERLLFSELLECGVDLAHCRLDGDDCCQFTAATDLESGAAGAEENTW